MWFRFHCLTDSKPLTPVYGKRVEPEFVVFVFASLCARILHIFLPHLSWIKKCSVNRRKMCQQKFFLPGRLNNEFTCFFFWLAARKVESLSFLTIAEIKKKDGEDPILVRGTILVKGPKMEARPPLFRNLHISGVHPSSRKGTHSNFDALWPIRCFFLFFLVFHYFCSDLCYLPVYTVSVWNTVIGLFNIYGFINMS